jgi:hypothetical protein
MYPYPDRVRWILFGRYSHLVKAIRNSPNDDVDLLARAAGLARWNLIRFIVSIPLALGVLAAVLGALARFIPGGLDDDVVTTLLGAATALTGVLTLAYLFLTRLLGQLEIDALALLTIRMRGKY